MDDLTLCIYDELVVKGSQEHEMLQGVWAGKRSIEIFGIEYAVGKVESTKHSPIDRYLKGAMNKTVITATRLIPIKMPTDVICEHGIGKAAFCKQCDEEKKRGDQ